MAFGDRIKKFIASRLEGDGGLAMVLGKQLLLKIGCPRRDEALAFMLQKFDAAAVTFKTWFDTPLPEIADAAIEDTLIAWVRDRVIKGFNAFADKACAVPPPVPAGAPAPEEVFGSPGYLQADEEIVAAANDPTLPD